MRIPYADCLAQWISGSDRVLQVRRQGMHLSKQRLRRAAGCEQFMCDLHALLTAQISLHFGTYISITVSMLGGDDEARDIPFPSRTLDVDDVACVLVAHERLHAG